MIVAIVTFRFDAPRAREQMKKVFEGSAPKYVDLPGLTRKNYFVSEDGLRGGGIYFWESKQAAERCYSGEWKERVAKLYGVTPEIQYLDSPVTVEHGEIRSD